MKKKVFWLSCLLLLFLITYWFVDNMNAQKEEYEVIIDDDLLTPGLVTVGDETEDWGLDEMESFFVEYRLQRDRVREEEYEMLQELINNQNTTPEAKQEAEALILKLTTAMETELLVENLLRAQGYEDSLFFYKNDYAVVMIKAEELSEKEFFQITESVANIIDVEPGMVQVIVQK